MRKLLLCILAIAFIVSPIFNVFAQYIRVKNVQFTLNNKPYYYIGANYWYGGLLALVNDPAHGKERLKKELDFLKSKGINNLRVLAGSEGKGRINGVDRVYPPLQPEHGLFDAKVLEGLDYLLSEMGKREMYAVLYLSNNWEWSGGFMQYVNWNGGLTDSAMVPKMTWDNQRDNTSKFYSCKPCIDDYNKQLNYILKHVNVYNKKAYINEPAIMAWELANEPRPMRPASNEVYKQWTTSTAAYIKSIDKNHLVTLGAEGIMGTEDMELYKETHASAAVDYLTIHIWPKNWGWFKDTSIVAGLPNVIAKTNDYINQHVSVASQLKKPLVIEEFGLPRDSHSFDPAHSANGRDSYYTFVFKRLLESRKAGDVIAGCNFWAFGGTARPVPGQLLWKQGDDMMGDPPQEEQGLNTVFDSDSIWTSIAKIAVLLR